MPRMTLNQGFEDDARSDSPMLSSPTPGPWHLGSLPPTGWRYILAPDNSEIAAVADWQENGDLHMEFGPNARTNANLIASAPDMLAALQLISRACEPGVDQSDDELEAFIANIQSLARAAILSALPT